MSVRSDRAAYGYRVGETHGGPAPALRLAMKTTIDVAAILER